MTEREIERLAELVSIKTNERYLDVAKTIIDERIASHQTTCPTAMEFKLTKAKLWGLVTGLTVGSGSIGGLIGAIIQGVLNT